MLRNLILPPPLLIVAMIGFGWVAMKMLESTSTLQSMAVLDLEAGSDAQYEDVTLVVFGSSQERSMVAARPLFRPDRRPFAVEVTALEEPPVTALPPPSDVFVAEPVVTPEPQIILVGYLDGPNGPRTLVRDLQTQNEIWLSERDVFEGWTVAEIRPDQILFQLEEQVFLVKLNR